MPSFRRQNSKPQQKKDSDLQLVTGLWITKSKDKKTTYMSGVTRKGEKYLLFKNNNKKGDNPADYYLYFTQLESQERRVNKKAEAQTEEFDEDVGEFVEEDAAPF